MNIQFVHFVTRYVVTRTDAIQSVAIGGNVTSAVVTAEDHHPFLRLNNLLADLQGIRRRRAHGRRT